MNNIPFNGRIAIIDDQFDQALPLINVLSQHQRPLTYFSGELKYLPGKENQINDVRILFLDINLIDNSEHPDRVLRARLVPVLSRVISDKNFPYVIIYWSREDNRIRNTIKHSELIEDIFRTDLKDRQPIGFVSAEKTQFFNLDGTTTDDIEEKVSQLFKKINDLIDTQPGYNHLLNWENMVHHSADGTLQDIFASHHSMDDWVQNTNFLIQKMGESYAGIANYKDQKQHDKIKNSFQAFNSVFIDSLEYAVSNQVISVVEELKYDKEKIQPNSIYAINKKLLISDDKEPLEYSGAVAEENDPLCEKIFVDLLNNCFARKVVEDRIRQMPEHKETDKTAIDKLVSNERKEIRKSWKKIYFVLTPLCDFVQKKFYNVRSVKGILIKGDFVNCIDSKSEAIFISPKFLFENEVYVLILHFRYFFTYDSTKEFKHLKPLFRVRQQLFAEVQSKLARHINRQGILYLE